MYNKKSNFGAKNHEFITRYIRHDKDISPEPYEYDAATGLVNINGSFVCSNKKLTSFRGIKFGIIKGDFKCDRNKFKSIEGFPTEVHGDYSIYRNNIESLVGIAKVILGKFDCESNNLKTLEGCPDIHGDFYCSGNPLTSLVGCPSVINGDFECTNTTLENLNFGPKKVKGNYDCAENMLTTLKGAPNKINGTFRCSGNNLVTLEGSPSLIKDDFICHTNNLESLVLGPKKVNGEYDFSYNSVTSFEGLATTKTVSANHNRIKVNELKNLPLCVEILNFDDNDTFIDNDFSDDLVRTFFGNRDISITIFLYKKQINDSIEFRKKHFENCVIRTKNTISVLEGKLELAKKNLEKEESDYFQIKDTTLENYLDSFGPKELQKGVSTLKRFSILE